MYRDQSMQIRQKQIVSTANTLIYATISWQHAFEYSNNGDCQWRFRVFPDHHYSIRNVINNSNNNTVNSCSAPLTPNKQEVISNPTGDINSITADDRTVLKELHSKLKQILTSVVSAVDSNST